MHALHNRLTLPTQLTLLLHLLLCALCALGSGLLLLTDAVHHLIHLLLLAGASIGSTRTSRGSAGTRGPSAGIGSTRTSRGSAGACGSSSSGDASASSSSAGASI